jgi:hypothetical protein
MIFSIVRVLVLFTLFSSDVHCRGRKTPQVKNLAMTPRYCGNQAKSHYCMNDKHATFPINAGHPLVYHKNGKTLENPTMYTIFYGGQNYWDTSTTSVYLEVIRLLADSSYMDPVAEILDASDGKGSKGSKGSSRVLYTMGKSVMYYGPPKLHSINAQINCLKMALKGPAGLPKDPNGAYLMIIDPGYSKPSNFKVGNNIFFNSMDGGFCGLHSTFDINVQQGKSKTSQVPYALIGTGGDACNWHLSDDIETPNPGFIDVTVSVISHEIGEILTDPFADAWYDDQGFENGDKCAGYLGGYNYISNTGKKVYNVVLGNGKYLLQSQYDLSNDSCLSDIFD